MKDIFEQHNLYPFTGKINDHFKGTFDEVFVALLPFADRDLHPDEGESAKKICQEAKRTTWERVCKGSGIENIQDLSKALKTNSFILETVYARKDLEELLSKYTFDSNLHEPIEGAYDALSKKAIYEAFRLLGKDHVMVTDEFYESTYSLELNEIDVYSFVDKIVFDAYYIYAEDHSLLFTIDWNSFFFLIAASRDDMHRIINSNKFEGFICDEHTEHIWDHTPEELESLQKKEVVHQFMKKGNKVWLVYWSLISLLLTWLVIKYHWIDGKVIYAEIQQWRDVVFHYSIREIILGIDVIGFIWAMVYVRLSKGGMLNYIAAAIFLLHWYLIQILHISKGP